MLKQSEDLVLRIVKQIQQTLSDHTKRFDDHTRRFDRIERRLDELNDGMIAALGLASHSHVRHDGIQREIEALKKRVKRLEARL
jgi:phage shock protein A